MGRNVKCLEGGGRAVEIVNGRVREAMCSAIVLGAERVILV